MCDYCDCRSQPEIRALSDEHERILDVVGNLRRAGAAAPDAVVGDLVAELIRLLIPHTAREEVGIFAALRHVTGDGYVDRFQDEHDVVDALLVAARTDRTAVARLVDVLTRHIADEESDMYPAARQVLDPFEWSAVDEAVAALLAVTAGQVTRG